MSATRPADVRPARRPGRRQARRARGTARRCRRSGSRGGPPRPRRPWTCRSTRARRWRPRAAGGWRHAVGRLRARRSGPRVPARRPSRAGRAPARSAPGPRPARSSPRRTVPMRTRTRRSTDGPDLGEHPPDLALPALGQDHPVPGQLVRPDALRPPTAVDAAAGSRCPSGAGWSTTRATPSSRVTPASSAVHLVGDQRRPRTPAAYSRSTPWLGCSTRCAQSPSLVSSSSPSESRSRRPTG